MKHFLLLFTLFLFFQNSSGQSKFSEGFESGYKNGYCQDQGISCMAPNPPNAPLPAIDESLYSYKDGYNRGFQIGLQAQRNSSRATGVTERRPAESSNNHAGSTGRKGYQTAKAVYVDNKMSNPFANIDMNNLMAVANALKKMKQQALDYFDEGNYQAAAQIGYAGYKVNNTDPEFMMIIGQAYRYSGDRKNAVKWYKSAARRTNDKNLRNLIRDLENGGELIPEEINNKKEEPSSPKGSSRHDELVDSFNKNYEEQNYEASLNIARQLVDIKPTFQYYVMRGMANEALKYYAKAIQDYREALRIEENPLVLFQLSNVYSEIGSYSNSIEGVEKLINSYSSDWPFDLATLYNNKAFALLKLKRYEESSPWIDKALDLNKTLWYIWDTKGELEYQLGNYEDAITAMTKANELNPHYNSLYYRGLSYIAIGKSQKGCMDLAKSSGMGNKEADKAIELECDF